MVTIICFRSTRIRFSVNFELGVTSLTNLCKNEEFKVCSEIEFNDYKRFHKDIEWLIIYKKKLRKWKQNIEDQHWNIKKCIFKLRSLKEDVWVRKIVNKTLSVYFNAKSQLQNIRFFLLESVNLNLNVALHYCFECRA